MNLNRRSFLNLLGLGAVAAVAAPAALATADAPGMDAWMPDSTPPVFDVDRDFETKFAAVRSHAVRLAWAEDVYTAGLISKDEFIQQLESW